VPASPALSPAHVRMRIPYLSRRIPKRVGLDRRVRVLEELNLLCRSNDQKLLVGHFYFE
jgi:hypothetical protein